MSLHTLSYSEELTDEKLERVFREIEEASERRALEEEAYSHPSPLDSFVSPRSDSLTNIAPEKKRRRGSISISRIGTYPDMAAAVQAELQQMTPSGTTSPLPWASTPMYKVETHAASGSSFGSTSSLSSSMHHRHHEEENHTTQKETIIGRRNTLTKAVSSKFAQTLMRMRSSGALDDVVARDEPVVIGVAVHEATTEVEIVEEAAGTGTGVPPDAEGALVSTSVSVEVKAVAAAAATTSRSRSGSINNIRSKRASVIPIRSQGPAEAKQVLGQSSNVNSNSKLSEGAGTNSEGEAMDGAKSSKSRRFSHFTKLLAQKLRRRSSANASLSVAAPSPSMHTAPLPVTSPATHAAGVPLPPSPVLVQSGASSSDTTTPNSFATPGIPVPVPTPAMVSLPPSPSPMVSASLAGPAQLGEYPESGSEPASTS